VKNGKVVKEPVNELAGNHEEADTRNCAHVKAIDSLNAKDIVIRASDTDIAVIMLYHLKNFANVWMDVGTASNNDRRYINLSAISAGSILMQCLGFYAFTGCNYTPAYAILEKDKPAQNGFCINVKRETRQCINRNSQVLHFKDVWGNSVQQVSIESTSLQSF
jgi:hypothetical protein